MLAVSVLRHRIRNTEKYRVQTSAVKPTSINITGKPKKVSSEIEYSIDCEVDGSIPETDIRWTQNNRQFERGKVLYEIYVVLKAYIHKHELRIYLLNI